MRRQSHNPTQPLLVAARRRANPRGRGRLFSLASLAWVVLFGVQCDQNRRPQPEVVGAVAGSQGSTRRLGPATEGAERAGLREPRPDLSFVDVDGNKSSLGAAASGKPQVIIVREKDCPVCRKQGRLLSRIESEWSARGVSFLFLNASQLDTTAGVREDRDTFGFKGPYVHDLDAKIAQALVATSTAEVFLYDAAGILRYRGAVDDRIGIGYKRETASAHYLVDAMTAVLVKRQPLVEATTAPGCFLDFEEVVAGLESPLFYEDIVPILQRACQTCHRAGEPAPFPLVSYDDVKEHSGIIRFVLENGSMPPWYADDHVGGPWSNDLRMSADDRASLLKWLGEGMPAGNPANAPSALGPSTGKMIHNPDLIVKIERVIEVPPEGLYQYEYALVDPGLDRDRWVERLELRSMHPDAIHHILLFEQPVGATVPKGLARYYLGLKSFYGVFLPGCESIDYPLETGKLMRKGSRFLFQLHYNGNGKAVQDRPEMRIVFADEEPAQELRCDAAHTVDINIPPYKADYPAAGEFEMPEDGKIYSFLPHMHIRGKSCVMRLTYPDGRVIKALSVSQFDFNWQQIYRLKEPIFVPKGTKVRMEAVFDNSAENPANPAPEKWVAFGLSTYDEMMVGYFEWVATDAKSQGKKN